MNLRNREVLKNQEFLGKTGKVGKYDDWKAIVFS